MEVTPRSPEGEGNARCAGLKVRPSGEDFEYQ